MNSVQTTSESRAELISAPSKVRAVTLRSVLLGLVGVLFICGLTPYNDYVLGNTFLVGNFLPIGLLLFMLFLVLVVNSVLHRFWSSAALTAGELAVILGMTLVSCSLPSSGLMRYLPASMIGVQHHAGIDADAKRVITELDLPNWIFPTFQTESVEQRSNEPVVTDFWSSVQADGNSFYARFIAVPWAAWARPALTWGLLIAALFGAVLSMMIIVRHQWVENERLAFPLASVYLSLIEPPAKGRAFNTLFSAKSFWIAFALVFFLHGDNALYQYLPKYIPQIPLRYDLNLVMSEGNWAFIDGTFKSSRIYFSIIGIVFFLQSKLAFSLWAFFAMSQVVKMSYKMYGSELQYKMQLDQMLGAIVAYGMLILWIGRHHWLLILKQMFRGHREGEFRGRYLGYPLVAWSFVACAAGVIVWLMLAGASFIGALVLFGMLMLFFIVLARIVAETGLIFVQIAVPLTRPWIYGLAQLGGIRTTGSSFFFSSWFNTLFTNDLREALSPYALHSMKVADDAAYAQEKPGQKPARFIGAIVLALIVGYFVAGASTLYVNYNYASTRNISPVSPINSYGVDSAPKSGILDATRDYLPPRTGPAEGHNRLGHFFTGLGITGFLSAMQLRFASWPLHPIGYLLVFTWPIHHTWFSIFVGWLAKVLLLRFGGASAYRAGRPFFIGLVVGEAGAAATWLIISLLRDSMDLSYYAVTLLPG